MHQPEVVRLAALLLALVVVAPVARTAWSGLLAGAFLVEFLTHGHPRALSALTDPPDRRPLDLPGTPADLYVRAGLVRGRPLVLVHGLSADGKDDPRVRELEARAKMAEDACRLTPEQRRSVERQIAETCAKRGWVLHAVNCRSNHVHVVVSAGVDKPKKIRIDLKAWATRALKKTADQGRDNWWAERGSIRFLDNEESLHGATLYVRDAQDLQRE